MTLGSFKNVLYKMCLQIIYMYKQDLALTHNCVLRQDMTQGQFLSRV